MQNKLRVLILEDFEDDALLMINSLKDSGFDPIYERVFDRASFEKMLNEREWDVICSDYQMPQFNAHNALETIQKKGLDIPFIVVSGTIGEDIAVNCMKKGAHDYLMKDNLKRLGSAIKREIKEAVIRKDHRRARKTLIESENKYRQLFENESDAVIVFDAESNKFEEANQKAFSLFGYNKESFLNLLVTDISDVKEKTVESVSRNFSRKEDNYIIPERRFIRKDGSLFYGEISAGSFVSNGRKKIIGIIRDITDRREAKETLLNREAQLRGIANSVPGVIFQFYARPNGEYGLYYINEQIKNIFGLDVNPIDISELFPTFFEHVSTECKEAFSLSIKKAVKTLSPWYYEGQFIKPDGEMIYFEGIAEPLQAKDEIIFNGVLFDITLRKKAEEHLLLIQTLLDNSNDGIFIVDPIDSKILNVNNKAAVSSGYTPQELLTMKIIDLEVSLPDNLSWNKHIENVRNKQHLIFEGVNKRKDGTLFNIEISINMLFQQDKEYLIAITRDITERKAAEELNKKLQAQLFHSQKMEAVGTMASGIAHNFNNILGAIRGSAEMALDDISPNANNARSDLERIIMAVKNAEKLTNQMLAYSRLPTENVNKIDIANIVIDSLNMFKASVKGSIKILENIDPNCGCVLADMYQIQHILLNLFRNSYQAMDKSNGFIEISLSPLTVDANIAKNFVNLKEGEYIKISIKDNGHGMDKRTSSRIFEPFFTTKEIGKGTGLGLSMVHGAITECGGHISVESEPDKGSTFIIILPRLQTNL
ncbi:MAG: PAS domain S-box protein [Candidatus Omnitrophica bacterium]|nr:PAS domain S-box protein [Candidatus Omnitrophota bacterium]MBU1995644.1 PAS domain S-box protein [Candidatus Omnitrophota bacterium]